MCQEMGQVVLKFKLSGLGFFHAGVIGHSNIAQFAVHRVGQNVRRRGRFVACAAASRLPEGDWTLTSGLDDPGDREEFALGWLLEGYRFTRYRAAGPPAARLVAPEGVDAARIEAIAAGESLTRDLINTPASDMGPDELEAAMADLAADCSAHLAVTNGAA